MQTITCISLAEMQPCALPSKTVLCLGNFDGVHLAHRALLRLAADLQKKEAPEASLAVFCFSKPSSDYLFADRAPAHLSTLSQKLSYFREEGIDYALLADFPSVRNCSKQVFAEQILKVECHCVGAVCGFNYRFGQGGSGQASELAELLGAPVWVQDEITAQGQAVSSTRIRGLLEKGLVEDANALLTRPYGFSAEIVHGKSLGKQWNTPTLNQFFPEGLLIPRHGVYVTENEIDGVCYRGVTNVGVHPTVDANAAVNCETFLLDFSGDLYGKTTKISFLKFLRPEQKFENPDALRAQIYADIEAARHS